ncbi:outer membrane protein [Pararhodonellum marinum]|uniref:outer membrane protein n=1 Tax=Pararhodonellum marinum TaxID=2755358 RepID=UPI00188FD79A|nr:hypothetical protein [Pararhodonellum marinum]
MKNLYLILIPVFFSTLVFGQQAEEEIHAWKFRVEPYLWLPSLQGQIAVENTPIFDIREPTRALLGSFKGGGLLYLEAENQDWAITSDYLFVSLENGLEISHPYERGELRLDQTMWEVTGMRKLVPGLEAGIGARLMSLNSHIYLSGSLENARFGFVRETWLDPLIVVRSKGIFSENWRWNLRGDVGGFRLGSVLTWQFQADIGYRFSRLFDLSISYRYMDINYVDGVANERVKFDLSSSGPVLKAGFNFH